MRKRNRLGICVVLERNPARKYHQRLHTCYIILYFVTLENLENFLTLIFGTAIIFSFFK